MTSPCVPLPPDDPVPPLKNTLLAALSHARSRKAAQQTLNTLQATTPVLHPLRSTLAALLRDRNTHQVLSWPAIEVAREVFHSIEVTLDRALQTALERNPLEALAHELHACSSDATRALHALDIAWQHASPPTARAVALMIDLLRAHPLGPARGTVYKFLIDHGADVRSVLADDQTLAVPERTEVLSKLAARHASQGRRRPVRWLPDPCIALARTLADWTQYATHPRQLFYWFRRHAGLQDRQAYLAALTAIEQWPLSPEVHAQLQWERSGEPCLVPARPLGSGRFECGRCGDSTVVLIARHPVDPADPLQGAENEFTCRTCDLQYFSTWEIETVVDNPPVPQGWVCT